MSIYLWAPHAVIPKQKIFPFSKPLYFGFFVYRDHSSCGYMGPSESKLILVHIRREGKCYSFAEQMHVARMVEILYVFKPYYKRNLETPHFLRLCFPSLIYAFHICVFSYSKGGGDLESHFQQPNLLAGVPCLIKISKNTYKASTVSSALLKCFNFFPYPLPLKQLLD